MSLLSSSRVFPAALVARLAGREALRKVLWNTGWLFADKALRMAVALLVGVWVARYLGPGRFGQYNYAIAFVTLFSPLATLGLNNIVVRDIVLLPSRKNETLGSAFGLRLCGGLVTLLLATAVAAVSGSHDRLTIALVAVTAAGTVFSAFDAIDLWFQSQLKSKFTVLAKNAALIVISAIKVLLIMYQASLLMFAWAGTAEIALGSFGLLLVYGRVGGSFRLWRFTLARAKSLLRDSWPLIFSGVFGAIYLRIDQVMIGEMVGNEEVGVYAAAVRLAEAWYFVPMTIVASVLPSVVEAKRISDDLFYSRLQRLYNLMAFFAYAIAIPTTFLSKSIIAVLYGSAYNSASPMLVVLIWSGLFINLGVARTSFLTAMNWTRTHLVINVIGCILNIALNYVLIPAYGGMGAAVATFIAYGVVGVLACFFYRPLYRTGYMLAKAMVYPKIW